MATDADRERRASFDAIPELYDRARPTYPEAVFDDLEESARLSVGSRVLEIGPGPGKATQPLAERGYEIVAVELGASMAAFAQHKLERFRNVEVVNASFETWQPVRTEFDAIVSFSAFHWISPEARYAKTASLLRVGGSLAVVRTRHVLLPNSDEFFAEVQNDYEAILPDATERSQGGPPAPDEAQGFASEIAASGLFGPVHEHRHLWDVTYTADEYIDVLDTYSDNRVLDDATRKALYERIRARAAARPGGRVRMTYLAILDVAQRL